MFCGSPLNHINPVRHPLNAVNVAFDLCTQGHNVVTMSADCWSDVCEATEEEEFIFRSTNFVL